MLLFILLLGPRTAHSNEAKPHEVDGKAEAHRKQVDPPPVKDPIQSISATPNSYYEHEPPKPKRSDPQWWSVGVNGVIAFTAFGTLLYLSAQIRAIRNTERAFLIPVWENLITWRASNDDPVTHCFQWKFRNCGKTPAFLREAVGKILIVETIDQLPKNPDYSGFVIYKGDPLIANEAMARNFISHMDDNRDFQAIEDEYRNGYGGGPKILFAYGMVRYDDMFRRRHETRFGLRFTISQYSITEDEFVIDGPDSYNKYT
jgi:hypothetical protein